MGSPIQNGAPLLMTNSSDPSCRIECRSVPDRRGDIEIGLVHPGSINIKNTNGPAVPVDQDVRAGIDPVWLEAAALTYQTEVEMTPAEATELIALLRDAIRQRERTNDSTTEFDDPSCRIACRSVPGRSGFVEIGLVNPGDINIEVMNIDPGKLPVGCDVRLHRGGHDAVTDNTEIEMTVSEAKRLIALLHDAIGKVESVVAAKREP